MKKKTTTTTKQTKRNNKKNNNNNKPMFRKKECSQNPGKCFFENAPRGLIFQSSSRL